ncbi:MAG: imidazole glycerol phosphate synthase subunit HisH [Eubacteriales bacterium]|nr:imidazole glycerol phosphate synthase subunit HisH [Eubacteriales bacterium]
MTAIIDYGAGNLHSVQNALDLLGEKSVVTGERDVIMSADRVILPGVGAFGDAMERLNQTGLADVVREVAKSGKPLLGICLGLQLMFESSEENPGVEGLGLFKGKCVKISETGLKIPHMGWNDIKVRENSYLLKGLGKEPYVYFVHSYYIQPDEDVVSAYTEYGAKLAVAVEKDNVAAVQFHPEKSSDIGMKILKNFIEREAI